MTPKRQTLFKQGDAGCFGFRIPTIISLPSGKTIAFCEARQHSMGDSGAIDIVARSSTDACASFDPIRTVVSGGGDTVGNPCPVYDPAVKRLFLLYNGNEAARPEHMILRGDGPRTVQVIHSDDEGETWSAPRDLTAALKPAGWTWYAMGPCHGICLPGGRLLLGANHAVLDSAAMRSGCYMSHVVYSDDHGETWSLGQTMGEGTNECALAGFEDGGVLINMRYIPFREGEVNPHCRAQAYSADFGQTFGETALRPDLPDPVCQGSVLSVKTERGEEVLLSNAGCETRALLTIRRSADRGKTWSVERVIEEGHSAYSDMACLGDGHIAVIFETGVESPYEQVALEMFKLND